MLRKQYHYEDVFSRWIDLVYNINPTFRPVNFATINLLYTKFSSDNSSSSTVVLFYNLSSTVILFSVKTL